MLRLSKGDLQKKKEFPPAYTRKLTIRLTEEMYDVLHRDAEAAMLSDSECVRQMILNRKIKYAPTVIHDDSAIIEELHNINKLSNTLNQIARYLNQCGSMTNPLTLELKIVLRKLDESCNELTRKMEEEYGGH